MTAVKEVTPLLPDSVQMYGFGDSADQVVVGNYLNQLISTQSKNPPPKNMNMGYNGRLIQKH